MVSWVLGDIPNDKKSDYETALKNAAAAAEKILSDGVDSAMNEYNS